MALISEIGSEEEADGDLVMWILVWSELVAFGALICGFLVMSFFHPESFSLAKLHLDARLASINTLVLITSGWLAAEAARAVSETIRRIALIASATLGLAFAAVKLLEYQGEWKFAGDATFHSFFELYFMITGFHLAHVIFLSLVMFLISRKPDRSNVAIVTTVWHVVDVVWLVIFPVVYLG